MKKNTFYIYFVLTISLFAKIAWEPPVLVTKNGILPKIKVVNSNVSYSYQSQKGKDLVFYVSPNNEKNVSLPVAKNENFIFYDFQQDARSNIHVLYSTSNTLDEIRIHPPLYVHITNIFKSENLLSPSLFYDDVHNMYITFYIKYTNKQYSVFARTASETSNVSFWSGEKIFLNKFEHAVQGSFFPVADFYSNEMLVVYSKRLGEDLNRYDTIYIKKSSDRAQTWSKETSLSREKVNATFPYLTIVGQHTFVSFLENQTNRNVPTFVLLHSTNQGQSFDRTEFTNFYYPIYFPKIIVVKENIYLFGYDYSKKHSVLFSRRYNFETKEWTEMTYLSQTNQNILNYSLAVDDNRVYIIYENENHNIYYRQNDVTAQPPIVFSSDVHTNFENYVDVFAIRWNAKKDISGIKGFGYVLDQSSNTIPDVLNMPAEINGKTFSYLDDGQYYFHIRTIDGSGNWSATTTYSFTINTSPILPPLISSSTHLPYVTSSNNNPTFVWSQSNEKRKIVGYSYLLSEDDTATPEKKIMITKKNKQFKNVKNGTWYFSVRAVDEHNHWSEVSRYTFSIFYKKPAKVVRKIIHSQSSNLFVYHVKHGDVLSRILKKILGLNSQTAYKAYLKDVAKFNALQDVDYLKPGDKIAFPVIVAKNKTPKSDLSKNLYGTTKKKNKILVVNNHETTQKGSTIKQGDMIILRDKYFLRTGKFPTSSNFGK